MDEFEKLYSDIKDLKAQGARNTAILSLKFLRAYGKEHGYKKDLIAKAEKLASARVTPSLLYNCVQAVKRSPEEKTINNLLRQLSESPKLIGQKGQSLIKNNFKIMTHCHSTEFMGIFAEAKKQGKKLEVYVTETRPKNQGFITVREISDLGFKVHLITDSAAGFYMKDVDMLLIGADAIRKEGIINKTGTLLIAIAAQKFNKPVYSAASTLKLDGRKKIEIEMRDPKEISDMKGTLNPAFDLTPWNYISRVITEKGIFTPANIKRLIK